MHRVTFFSRPECSLCRAAWFVVQRVRARVPFDVDVIDISTPGNESWLEAYKNDIPVVHLNEREVFRHRIDERSFVRLLTE